MSPVARDLAEHVIAAARAGQWRRAYATFLPIGARSGPERLFYRAFGWYWTRPRRGTKRSDAHDRRARGVVTVRRQFTRRAGGQPHARPRGRAGSRVPLERARAFAAGFGDGRLVVMPRTAHDLPASAIRDHVSGFLDEDSSRRSVMSAHSGRGQPVTGATPASGAHRRGPAPAPGPSRSGGRGRP